MSTHADRKKASEQEFRPREEFFKDIDTFTDWITRTHPQARTLQYNRLTETVVNTVRMVSGYKNDFTFRVVRCEHKTGSGNVFTVWYHPKERFREGMLPVLEVWWPLKLTKHCSERTYVRKDEWRRLLKSYIDQWKQDRQIKAA
jgi:hypothetical protein